MIGQALEPDTNSSQCDMQEMNPTPLRISTDTAELDLPRLHGFLAGSPGWAEGIAFETFCRSIEHSLCFGGYVEAEQVAFARVISDRATFATVVDAFVLPEHHGWGYGRMLMRAMLTHPELQRLHVGFGFAPPTLPLAVMERYCPEADSLSAARTFVAPSADMDSLYLPWTGHWPTESPGRSQTLATTCKEAGDSS